MFSFSHVCDVIEFRDDHARMRINVSLASFARFERARIWWISYVRLILKLLQICVVSIATRLWRWNFLTLWIGCSYVASCKWGMRATKIRLLFCYFLFSKCQFVLRELIRRLYLTCRGVTSRLVSSLLCLLHEQHQGLQVCVVIQYLALPRSMIVAIEQISFIGWNSCIPRTFLF